MDGNASALAQHYSMGKLFKFVLPTIFAVLLASLYSIVDGIFVSNFGGTTAFAAINQVSPVFMIIAAIGFPTMSLRPRTTTCLPEVSIP